MIQEQLQEFNKKVAQHNLPRWKDLPELELYMDQVIVLMQKYLGPYKRNAPGCILLGY